MQGRRSRSRLIKIATFPPLRNDSDDGPATGFEYDTIEYAPSVREWQVYLVQKAIDLRRR